MKTKIIILLFIFFSLPTLIHANTKTTAHSFTWPLDSWNFSQTDQKFGSKRAPGIYHLGDDIGAAAGSPIYAVATGIVKHIGMATDFGTVILIEHTLSSNEKIVSLYGHLAKKVNVTENQFVNKNQIIGAIGTTEENGGWPEHLHFGIRKGEYINANKTWVYWGLGSKEKLNDWYNPTEFLWYKINNPDVNTGKIITAPNYPGRSHIRIFNEKGLAIPSFDFFAYSPKNKKGFQIALGDINNNQQQELIISTNKYKPNIKIFNKNTQDLITSFKPFKKKYKGQINLTTADLNSDGQDEIIASTSFSQYPKIKIFSYNSLDKTFFESIKIPNPFSRKIKCGINLTVADLNNDGAKEILATPANKRKSVIKYYNGQSWQIFKKQIFKKTNAKLAAGDIDNNGQEEILAASQTGTRSIIKIINQNGHVRKKTIKPFAYQYQNGINISTTDFNNDGILDIIASLNKNAPPKVKVIQYQKKLVLSSFLAYDNNFWGGVNVVGIK